MNIVLFVNRDIEANIAYNLMTPALTAHNVRVYYSESVGVRSRKPPDLLKLEHFEQTFLYESLPSIVNSLQIASSFEFFDPASTRVPFEKTIAINTPAFIEHMRAYDPDLFISIRFGRIFEDEIIRIPSKGILNLHSAILPHYRGVMGTLHAIREGNQQIGCTLHTIPTKGIDTGDIIEIAKCNVNPERSLFWNIVQLYPLGVVMLQHALERIEHGERIIARPQDPAEGTYYSIPTNQDIEDVKKRGMEILTRVDYLDVLNTFLFKGISEDRKHHLEAHIFRAFAHFSQIDP